MTREELDERLKRAAEARRILRRASIKLMALGEQLMREREAARHADRSG
jgi:hypothetical protein